MRPLSHGHDVVMPGKKMKCGHISGAVGMFAYLNCDMFQIHAGFETNNKRSDPAYIHKCHQIQHRQSDDL